MNTKDNCVMIYSCAKGRLRVFTANTGVEKNAAAGAIVRLMVRNNDITEPVAPLIPQEWKKYIDMPFGKRELLNDYEKVTCGFVQDTLKNAWMEYESALNAWNNAVAIFDGNHPSIVVRRRKFSETNSEWNEITDESEYRSVPTGTFKLCSAYEALEEILLHSTGRVVFSELNPSH